MRITRLVVAEILGRPLNFLLCLVVIVVAAILFIVGPTILSGYAADTRQQLQSLQQETDAALTAMTLDAAGTLALAASTSADNIRALRAHLPNPPPDDDLPALGATFARLAQSLVLTPDGPPNLDSPRAMRQYAEALGEAMDGGAHLGCRDAAGAVQGGEDLAEKDHLATHTGVFLDKEHLVAHVAQLEGRFHARDAAANDERVVFLDGFRRHDASAPDGPISASILENSCM